MTPEFEVVVDRLPDWPLDAGRRHAEALASELESALANVEWVPGPFPPRVRISLDGACRLSVRDFNAVAVYDLTHLERNWRRRCRWGLGWIPRNLAVARAAARADLLLAASPELAARLRSGLLVPERRIHTLSPAVPEGWSRVSRPEAAASARTAGLPNRYVLIAADDQPGSDQVLELLATGLPEDTGLGVLAPPRYRRRLPARAVRIDPHPSEWLALISGAAVFVDLETGGSGQRVAEAMACGCPGVAVRDTAQASAMAEGGITLISGEPQLYADAVHVVVTNPDLRSGLSRHALRVAAGLGARAAAAGVAQALARAWAGSASG